MRIQYKNTKLEVGLIAVNTVTSALVAASFVMLFGFYRSIVPAEFLYTLQTVVLFVFIAEKLIRLFNADSKFEFFKGNWFEIPFLVALGVVLYGAGRWFGRYDPLAMRHFAVGIYLVIQVVMKLCKTCVNLAATGKNPTRVLIASFIFMITAGAGLLMLPRASTNEPLSFIDAIFTSTSATCVTGLIVKDTGKDFTLMGQIVILSLIQLGGLGIVVFGAIFALLLGQALTIRGQVAMQDLLSASTLGRIGNMIFFIFVGTLVIETIGAISLFSVWDEAPDWIGSVHQQWFYSIFHSISAFCNAGFSLFSDSFIRYNRSWAIYSVICPLVILGGLGFGVLYNLFNLAADRTTRLFKKAVSKHHRFSMEVPKRMHLQTKIVLAASALLIIFGTAAIYFCEHYSVGASAQKNGVLTALFQSITARTAGFNTIDISAMSPASKFIMILLMFVGGSPGSTAGGIKTVTLVVIIMTAIAALRKRSEVEMFRRSVRIVVVGRAITVTLLFVFVLFTAALALSITERGSSFEMGDIFFETASALGTVGLSTGITGSLTSAGKSIIILAMLIGRLGPLTLLAVLTFNLKPARYSYPQEAIIVG